MKYKQVLSRRNYKAGYVIVKGIMDGNEFGCEDYEMAHAETPSGDYLGGPEWGYRLCKKYGIKPEKSNPEYSICSIGFCEKEQKWYGWSHRAIYGFGIGDVVKEGDCTNSSGWTQEYLDEHSEEDLSLPVGFKAKDMAGAKRMAIAFAESVS